MDGYKNSIFFILLYGLYLKNFIKYFIEKFNFYSDIEYC